MGYNYSHQSGGPSRRNRDALKVWNIECLLSLGDSHNVTDSIFSQVVSGWNIDDLLSPWGNRGWNIDALYCEGPPEWNIVTLLRGVHKYET